ncbi:MAG: hypothetical protein DRP35_06765 [Candidatus Zixiibacteriota bacterium]|nr:MAG: hypothetical protein DRP35_06765 [candidate division Zixibacteria bacterium]
MENLKFEIKENGIGILTLYRPEKHNAFNPSLLKELSTFLDKENNDSELRLLIITGSGEKSFSSGVDLKALLDFNDIEDARQFALLLESTSEKIFNFSKPTIALINGYALGGGFGYSSACDMRIMVDSAKVGFPAIKLGAILPVTCTLYLNALIGIGKARDLLLTGRLVDAQEALSLGMVNRIYPIETIWEETFKIAETILEGNDTAITYTKKTVNHTLLKEIESQKLYAADNFAYLSQTKEWQKRMNDFSNKKKK